MKKSIKKLTLSKITISNLNSSEMERKIGGNLFRPKLTKITQCKTTVYIAIPVFNHLQ